MGMMLLRIELFFHAFTSFVYSIPFLLQSIVLNSSQEDNDQAFFDAV